MQRRVGVGVRGRPVRLLTGRGRPVTVARPNPPGQLTDPDRDGVARLWGAARAEHRWAPVAGLLTGLRAGGVPVAGVSAESVRAVCRRHSPGPDSVGDPITAAGWVRTPDAARLLGVGRDRLEELGAAGTGAGVSVVVGWHRRWHARSLTAWWAQAGPVTRTETRRAAAGARAARVRAAVAAGGTVQSAADTEGVHPHTVWRDLRATENR